MRTAQLIVWINAALQQWSHKPKTFWAVSISLNIESSFAYFLDCFLVLHCKHEAPSSNNFFGCDIITTYNRPKTFNNPSLYIFLNKLSILKRPGIIGFNARSHGCVKYWRPFDSKWRKLLLGCQTYGLSWGVLKHLFETIALSAIFIIPSFQSSTMYGSFHGWDWASYIKRLSFGLYFLLAAKGTFLSVQLLLFIQRWWSIFPPV